MAKVIGIMGESGSGKTTSLRNLDPMTTFYIDCDKKGLSWRNWREQYNSANKNYLKTDNKDTVMLALAKINCDKNKYAALHPKHEEITEEQIEKAKSFKTVVIDTLNGIMVSDEVERMKEKGYDKWTDLAHSMPQLS